MTDVDLCPQAEEVGGAHCDHWWNCEPCCRCGFDGGGEDDCDCPRHTAMREQSAE